MKKKILLLMGVFAFGLLQAQVGINTNNPLGVFHIDAARNNSATPTAAQLQDDVIFTSDGKLGLGMVPSATDSSPLQINGSIMVWYGDPTPGKVFTSTGTDGNGEFLPPAIWYEPYESLTNTPFHPGAQLYLDATVSPDNTYKYTGIKIDLPIGSMYAVNLEIPIILSVPVTGFSSLYSQNGAMFVATLAHGDHTTTFSRSPNLTFQPKNLVASLDGGMGLAALQGTIFVDNTLATAVTTYYLWATINNRNLSIYPYNSYFNIGGDAYNGMTRVAVYKIKKEVY